MECRIVCGFFFQQFDCFRFIVLDTDVNIFQFQIFCNSAGTGQQFFGFVHTGTIVGGDIWLAFCGIDYQSIDHVQIFQVELNEGWETCAAQTNQTGIFNSFQEFWIVAYNRWFYLLGHFLQTICFDDDVLVSTTHAGCHSGNCFHSTGNTGVGFCAHKCGGVADQLTHLNAVSFFHQWFAGCAHVLMQ